MSDLPLGAQRVVEAMYGMARHTIIATSVGLVPLDHEQRLALLSGIDSKEVLVALGEMQAELDAAMLSHAETLPLEAARIVDSQWYEPVRQQLAAGHRLAPPQTMVRLMRETIEAGEGLRLGISDDDALLQLLLSVNEDHDTSSGLAARFNAMDIHQVDAEMRSMSEDGLLAFANEMAVDEAASMMFNASRLPEHMKCMTHEFWYQPWAEKVGDQLGATPADTFREATEISMDEFLRAGDVITPVLRTGRARFDLGSLHEHGVSDEVVQYIQRNIVGDLDEFRAMSQRDRERGDVRSQRYTFTQFPFLDLGDGTVLALRAQWGMDRFFGNAPEFDVQQGFVEQGRPGRAKQVPGCGQAPIRADRRSHRGPNRCAQCGIQPHRRRRGDAGRVACEERRAAEGVRLDAGDRQSVRLAHRRDPPPTEATAGRRVGKRRGLRLQPRSVPDEQEVPSVRVRDGPPDRERLGRNIVHGCDVCALHSRARCRTPEHTYVDDARRALFSRDDGDLRGQDASARCRLDLRPYVTRRAGRDPRRRGGKPDPGLAAGRGHAAPAVPRGMWFPVSPMSASRSHNSC